MTRKTKTVKIKAKTMRGKHTKKKPQSCPRTGPFYVAMTTRHTDDAEITNTMQEAIRIGRAWFKHNVIDNHPDGDSAWWVETMKYDKKTHTLEPTGKNCHNGQSYDHEKECEKYGWC